VDLAFRNHGMMAELLRTDITPLGAHYLLQGRGTITQAVTMECAGTGRRNLQPRPVYVPWDKEAIGTYRWTGTPLRPLLEQAGLASNAVEVLFTGWDSGIDLGIEHAFERSLPVADAMRDEVMLNLDTVILQTADLACENREIRGAWHHAGGGPGASVRGMG
jgi:sulfane dehydrogenase subunit SoxC